MTGHADKATRSRNDLERNYLDLLPDLNADAQASWLGRYPKPDSAPGHADERHRAANALDPSAKVPHLFTNVPFDSLFIFTSMRQRLPQNSPAPLQLSHAALMTQMNAKCGYQMPDTASSHHLLWGSHGYRCRESQEDFGAPIRSKGRSTASAAAIVQRCPKH